MSLTEHRISPFKHLLSHSRFLLTLRSEQGKYHSLILFRLSSASETIWDHRPTPPSDTARDGRVTPPKSDGMLENRQIYVMESTCPHLGADMSHAEIEGGYEASPCSRTLYSIFLEFEDTTVAVCPWHRRVFRDI